LQRSWRGRMLGIIGQPLLSVLKCQVGITHIVFVSYVVQALLFRGSAALVSGESDLEQQGCSSRAVSVGGWVRMQSKWPRLTPAKSSLASARGTAERAITSTHFWVHISWFLFDLDDTCHRSPVAESTPSGTKQIRFRWAPYRFLDRPDESELQKNRTILIGRSEP